MQLCEPYYTYKGFFFFFFFQIPLSALQTFPSFARTGTSFLITTVLKYSMKSQMCSAYCGQQKAFHILVLGMSPTPPQVPFYRIYETKTCQGPSTSLAFIIFGSTVSCEIIKLVFNWMCKDSNFTANVDPAHSRKNIKAGKLCILIHFNCLFFFFLQSYF